jgi:hypothetical protein
MVCDKQQQLFSFKKQFVGVITYQVFKYKYIYRCKISPFNWLRCCYSWNLIDVDWGLVVKLALPGKVTRRSYKVFGIYDTNVLSRAINFGR